MIVLIDNYDSFSYNLYQLLGQFDPDITVIRNDEKTVQDIEAMHPDHLIISPGPGRPADAGVCEEAIRPSCPSPYHESTSLQGYGHCFSRRWWF